MSGSVRPLGFVSISYEDIHSDPIGASRRLFELCGIPVNDATLKATVEATDFAANYTPNERGFRRGGRVGDWRQAFTPEDRIGVRPGRGPGADRLGLRTRQFVGPRP